MKNLQNYGVQELNARELQTTDGGNPIARRVIKWLWTALGVANALEDIKTGFNEGNSGECC